MRESALILFQEALISDCSYATVEKPAFTVSITRITSTCAAAPSTA